MYRRQTSGRFIVLTTAGIVVVMSIFTWVMYGMAQKVEIMTATMLQMNNSVIKMTEIQERMAADMSGMHDNLTTMNVTVGSMDTSVSRMDHNVTRLSASVGVMAVSVDNMAVIFSTLSRDMGRVSHAFTQPMSYMWGNMFPF